MIAVVWLLVLLCSSNNSSNLPENHNFPYLRQNLPIFPICQAMMWCLFSYHSQCPVMRGDVHLETSGCPGAWNVRINLNCSFEWAAWIIEKHFFGVISLDTSSILWLSIAEICSCSVFSSRSFCLPLLSVNPLEKFHCPGGHLMVVSKSLVMSP